MTQTLRPLESRVADALRYPLTLLVLWTHCVIVREASAITELSWEQAHLFFEQFVRGFGPICVGLFAIISGYYLFLKGRDFSMAYYQQAVRKRFWSLFVPCLLWNALAIVALWSKVSIAQAVNFAPGIVPVEVDLLGSVSLKHLFIEPMDSSLWYVRELVYLCLLSPIVYLALRTMGYWWILLLIVAQYTGIPPMWWPADFGISVYFSLGAWLALESRTILDLVPRAGWGKAIVLLLAICFPLVLNFMPGMTLYYIARFLTQSAWIIVLVWWMRHLLTTSQVGVGLGGRLLKVCEEWGPASFFIYAMHTILWINLFRGILYTTALGQMSAGPSIIFVLTAILTTLACMLSYRIMHRFTPRLLSLLMGDR